MPGGPSIKIMSLGFFPATFFALVRTLETSFPEKDLHITHTVTRSSHRIFRRGRGANGVRSVGDTEVKYSSSGHNKRAQCASVNPSARRSATRAPQIGNADRSDCSCCSIAMGRSRPQPSRNEKSVFKSRYRQPRPRVQIQLNTDGKSLRICKLLELRLDSIDHRSLARRLPLWKAGAIFRHRGQEPRI